MTVRSVHRSSRSSLRPWVACLIALVGAVSTTSRDAVGQSQRYELDSLDRWKKVADIDPASEEAQVLAARRALVNGETARAEKLANGFLDRYPLSRYRADVLLIRGDAKRGQDEYEALFDYEEICRRYPGSEVFIPTLERQYEIAVDYAKGLRRRFFGTVRIVDTTEDAQELLIRVQERLPGSELAERACMQLADFYFDRREMIMAAETYRIFMENFPRSPSVNKARLRLIYAYLAGFRGPEYDASGLLEARARLRTLQGLQPALAQQVGAESIIVRIEESEAAKFLATARWYLEVDDAISAELNLRRLIQRHPKSIAALEALRMMPTVLPRLPQAIIDDAPDYRALRREILRIEWDESAPAMDAVPAPEPPAAAGAAS